MGSQEFGAETEGGRNGCFNHNQGLGAETEMHTCNASYLHKCNSSQNSQQELKLKELYTVPK